MRSSFPAGNGAFIGHQQAHDFRICRGDLISDLTAAVHRSLHSGLGWGTGWFRRALQILRAGRDLLNLYDTTEFSQLGGEFPLSGMARGEDSELGMVPRGLDVVAAEGKSETA